MRNSRQIFCKMSSDFKSAFVPKIPYLIFSALPEFILLIISFKSSFPLWQSRWKSVLVLGPLPGGTGCVRNLFMSLHVHDGLELAAAGPPPCAAWLPCTQCLLLLTTQFWTFRIMLTVFLNTQEVIFCLKPHYGFYNALQL